MEVTTTMEITSPGPPTKLRNECLGFIHIVFLFRVIIMRLSTQLVPWDAVKQKIPAASRLLSGEKVAHFENDIASEK